VIKLKETIKKEIEDMMKKQRMPTILAKPLITLAIEYWAAGFKKYHKLLRDGNDEKIEELLKEFAIE